MRRKIDSFPIAGVAAADLVLAELADIERQLDAVQASTDKKIEAAKKEAIASSKPLIERQKTITRSLLVFATENQDLFKKKRSLELSFGSFGWRRSTKVRPLPGHNWKTILGHIKATGIDAIRVKETVDREKLHALSAEELQLVGARRVTAEDFWVEVVKNKVRI